MSLATMSQRLLVTETLPAAFAGVDRLLLISTGRAPTSVRDFLMANQAASLPAAGNA